MSDRNAMLQGLYSPMMQVGIIPTKGFLDMDEIARFQENAANPAIAGRCFPGGQNPENHSIQIGDLCFGKKDTRNSDVADGEPAELSIVSVAGMNWDEFCSQREMEDEWYFQGVSVTEDRLYAPMDGSTMDPEHGHAMVAAGTTSVINNGHRTFYPGNLVAWQMPRAPLHPKAEGELFNDGNLINKTARHGVSPTQFRFEIVPFDYTDFSVPFAGAFAAMSNPKSMNGIKDIPLKYALPNASYQQARKWSCIQDDALSLKNGSAAIALSFIETLMRKGILTLGPGSTGTARADAFSIGQRLGLYQDVNVPLVTAEHETLMECMADLFLTNICAGDDNRRKAETQFYNSSGVTVAEAASTTPETPEQCYNRLRVHGLDIFVQGLAGSWHSKTEKVVGRCFSASATGDTTDVLWQHTTI